MSRKLYPVEVGRWKGVRIIESPASAFTKMRDGRLRLEAIVKKEKDRRAKAMEAIQRHREFLRQRIEREEAEARQRQRREDARRLLKEEAARQAEAKRWKWWWQK